MSSSNAFPYESTWQLSAVERVCARVSPRVQYFPLPVRLKQRMRGHAEAVARRKGALLSKAHLEEIRSLQKGRLMVASLDKNIYTALKNAFIFEESRQLAAISRYLSHNPHG